LNSQTINKTTISILHIQDCTYKTAHTRLHIRLSITFKANTNGASALINVNIIAGNNTQVYDNTSSEFPRLQGRRGRINNIPGWK